MTTSWSSPFLLCGWLCSRCEFHAGQSLYTLPPLQLVPLSREDNVAAPRTVCPILRLLKKRLCSINRCHTRNDSVIRATDERGCRTGLSTASGSEERKKGERGLQIEEEENEGRIGRNNTMTEGRCDPTERGEERAEQDQRVKGGARRLVKAKDMVRHHLPFRFRLSAISLLDAT
jgi:hypothetical protein